VEVQEVQVLEPKIAPEVLVEQGQLVLCKSQGVEEVQD
jgi:hypothetical protein